MKKMLNDLNFCQCIGSVQVCKSVISVWNLINVNLINLIKLSVLADDVAHLRINSNVWLFLFILFLLIH